MSDLVIDSTNIQTFEPKIVIRIITMPSLKPMPVLDRISKTYPKINEFTLKVNSKSIKSDSMSGDSGFKTLKVM